jgi:hypothetical protein
MWFCYAGWRRFQILEREQQDRQPLIPTAAAIRPDPPAGGYTSVHVRPWQPSYPVVHASAISSSSASSSSINRLPSAPSPVGNGEGGALPSVNENGNHQYHDNGRLASTSTSSIGDGIVISSPSPNYHTLHAHVINTPIASKQ